MMKFYFTFIKWLSEHKEEQIRVLTALEELFKVSFVSPLDQENLTKRYILVHYPI